MESKFTFDYYYGVEAEQFSFYRIPRALIKDNRFKELSSDAKLLYGLMLDRMAMSMKNGWLDSENRVYIIYTLENIMDDLNCGKDKGVKILAELDRTKGVGLIERKKRGLGKPTIIYVKNFITCAVQEDERMSETTDGANKVFLNDNEEVQSSEKPKSGEAASRSPEFGKTEVLTSDMSKSEKNVYRSPEFGKTEALASDMQTSGLLENRSVDFGKTDTNYNNTNYNELNYNNHINQSAQGPQAANEKTDAIDMMDEINIYMQMIRENIEYDYYMSYGVGKDKEMVEELYQIICDVVCVKRSTIRIGKEEYPYELVKAKFLKLKQSHIEYVMGCMKNTVTKIGNIRSYMITTLYNAPSTINHYFQQEVNHDMFGGGWVEKGIV